MKQAILIYTSDPWHSFRSMELIAVATTEKKRDTIVRRYLRNYMAERLPAELIDQAAEEVGATGQTQCLSEKAGFELYTETVDTNIILE